MKTVGLITEYNPFHNGHLHHLQESVRTVGAEASVAVMSGHFLQRGEPALVDKWVRTEMALAAGVDLVFELPLPFACNSAPYFAQGAVQSLAGLGVVDALCFGSEVGRLDDLLRAARLLNQRADEVEQGTAALLREGLNYPTARAEVLQALAPDLSADLLASPNNILGLEYLRALQAVDSALEPCTIKRLGPGYHDVTTSGEIASATGIRQMLAAGESVQNFLPASCWQVFDQALMAGQHLDWSKMFNQLLSRLLLDPENLESLYQVEHGLGNRLTETAQTARDYANLAAAVKSRHWTLTRVQRILAYVLLQVTHREMGTFLETGPLYLRLLGMSETGQRCLAEARSQRSLPIVMDPAKATAVFRKFYGKDQERIRLAESMLALDLRATRIYTTLMKSPWVGHRNRDFFEPVRRGSQKRN